MTLENVCRNESLLVKIMYIIWENWGDLGLVSDLCANSFSTCILMRWDDDW